MGFWKKTYKVYQDVSSLGGTYLLRKKLEERTTLISVYDNLCLAIRDCHTDVAALTISVQRKILKSERKLLAIQKILNPLCARTRAHRAFDRDASMIHSSSSSERVTDKWSSTHKATAVGLAAGGASTAGSWGAVQVIGHASTHTAMAGLHGAAASNAGWAWFGGGSLATQGGGMALGHLVLPGIGAAVLVGFSATVSYKEASKVGAECRELLAANRKNAMVLKNGQDSASSLSTLETRLLFQGGRLSDSLREARRQLFPLGYLSHLWRRLMLLLYGSYYKAGELARLEDLNDAAARFVAAFKNG